MAGDPATVRDRQLQQSELAQSVDLFPTILEIAGVPAPSDIQGVSLFSSPSEREDFAYASLRLDQNFLRTLIRPPWKLVQNINRGRSQLFHLDRDPGEKENVRARYPKVAAELKQEMEAIVRRSAELHHTAPQRADADLGVRVRELLEDLGNIESSRP